MDSPSTARAELATDRMQPRRAVARGTGYGLVVPAQQQTPGTRRGSGDRADDGLGGVPAADLYLLGTKSSRSPA
ncbi:hypothetical protein GCM10010206_17910 [Streptomyces cinerochromogenes]|nr:hypothetical protein GCM10010206_17910 [Streptomyces cinerochromogenes]